MPKILWLHVISDALITIAYFSIPITLLYILKKRRDIPFGWMVVAFGIFIFACGTTHVMEIWTIWIPNYWLSGFIKLLTAVASIVTATLLVYLIPKILSWPSPEQLQYLNNELQAQNNELNKINKKLADTQQQLLQSEKMASLGQLAAGVAHEINNPIGYVWSNFKSLEDYQKKYTLLLNAYAAYDQTFSKDNEHHKKIIQLKHDIEFEFIQDDIPALLKECTDGLTRVQKIVKDLKDFSHPDSDEEWVYSDIHEGLESTLSIAWSEIKYKAHVIKEYGTLPSIECLPAQLNQVFLNILINAVQAIETQGTITLQTHHDQTHVYIRITDTGSGIPKDILGRIFDPFFTTKEIGKGTGLGLSLSYGIIQKHHGTITAESIVGKGTTFIIRLPIKQP